MSDPEYLFIAAHSRSGSTLIDRVLSSSKDVCSVGELRYIWQRSVLDNQLCGCDTEYKECPFWSEVIRDAFGQMSNSFVAKMIDSDSKLKKPLNIIKLMNGQDVCSDYVQAMNQLVLSISKVSGKRIVLDSSKTPTYGLAIANTFGKKNTKVIFVTRDPRAIAYSRTRLKSRPEIHWKDENMAITSPQKTAIQWVYFNLVCELLNSKYSGRRIKYEDFVSSPETVSLILSRYVGCEPPVFLSKSELEINLSHSVAGNPMRFKTGLIEISPDSEWMNKLSLFNKSIVKYMTYPLLRCYGYK